MAPDPVRVLSFSRKPRTGADGGNLRRHCRYDAISEPWMRGAYGGADVLDSRSRVASIMPSSRACRSVNADCCSCSKSTRRSRESIRRSRESSRLFKELSRESTRLSKESIRLFKELSRESIRLPRDFSTESIRLFMELSRESIRLPRYLSTESMRCSTESIRLFMERSKESILRFVIWNRVSISPPSPTPTAIMAIVSGVMQPIYTLCRPIAIGS